MQDYNTIRAVQTQLGSYLPVVHVPHEEGFGREGIRLYLHVRTGHLVHEAGLPDVGKPTHQDGPRVGIDGGQPSQMLSHLLQVLQALVLPLHYGTHPTHGRLLQLLAPVQRVTILHKPDVILCYVIDKVLGSVYLPQR